MFQGAHELRAQRQSRSSATAAPKVSFEFFPPSTPAIEATLWKSVDRLKSLAPEFVSVTYGADGSTRDNTHRVIKTLGETTDIPTMPHLTCIDASKRDVDEVADSYWDIGVKSIMALRGDPAAGAGTVYTPRADGYHFAADLVEGLKRRHDFRIGVAAYPETHPEAPSAHFDIDNLKRKFDAGADFAISQFFFSTDAYLRFRDRCVLAGIDKPIIPGILPVTNFNTLKRFSGACGTELPRWLHDSFEGLDDDPETRQLIAANIAIEQVLALQNEGVNEFHFYTLNRAELCYAVCHTLGVRPPVKQVNEDK